MIAADKTSTTTSSSATRLAHPKVEWSAAARMRDRLVHHYCLHLGGRRVRSALGSLISVAQTSEDPAEVHPSAPASPGWYHDPAKRHQERYFDGNEWTGKARNGGEGVYDPVPWMLPSAEARSDSPDSDSGVGAAPFAAEEQVYATNPGLLRRIVLTGVIALAGLVVWPLAPWALWRALKLRRTAPTLDGRRLAGVSIVGVLAIASMWMVGLILAMGFWFTLLPGDENDDATSVAEGVQGGAIAVLTLAAMLLLWPISRAWRQPTAAKSEGGRKTRRLAAALISAGAVVVLFLPAVVLARTFQNDRCGAYWPSEEASVPNTVGMTVREAKVLLCEHGFGRVEASDQDRARGRQIPPDSRWVVLDQPTGAHRKGDAVQLVAVSPAEAEELAEFVEDSRPREEPTTPAVPPADTTREPDYDELAYVATVRAAIPELIDTDEELVELGQAVCELFEESNSRDFVRLTMFDVGTNIGLSQDRAVEFGATVIGAATATFCPDYS